MARSKVQEETKEELKIEEQSLLGVDKKELVEIDEEMTIDQIELSDEEIEKQLDIDKFPEDEYIDSRISAVKRTTALLRFWKEISAQLDSVREGYSLAKAWKDDELKKRYLAEGGPLIKKQQIVKDRLEVILPVLKGVAFLPPGELELLPTWALKLLGVDIQKIK